MFLTTSFLSRLSTLVYIPECLLLVLCQLFIQYTYLAVLKCKFGSWTLSISYLAALTCQYGSWSLSMSYLAALTCQYGSWSLSVISGCFNMSIWKLTPLYVISGCFNMSIWKLNPFYLTSGCFNKSITNLNPHYLHYYRIYYTILAVFLFFLICLQMIRHISVYEWDAVVYLRKACIILWGNSWLIDVAYVDLIPERINAGITNRENKV